MIKQDKFDITNGLKEVLELIKNSKNNPMLIGVCGGTGSGKGFFSKKLLNITKGRILHLDDYYLGINEVTDKNFDRPSALDFDLILKHIKKLKNKETINKPTYDFSVSLRDGLEEFIPSNLLLIEGLFALDPRIVDCLDLKIYIAASEERRLERRIKRDLAERGRTLESIKHDFNTFVKPNHIKYVKPQKAIADVIILN